MTGLAHARLDAGGRALDPDAYYAALTARNRGLVSEAVQARLRSARVLVAGCGSVGGAVVEPLVRFGAERLTLADPDTYGLANLNRQRAGVDDIGQNKAAVQAGRARQINPFADIGVEASGITSANVAELVSAADIVIDGVDVTAAESIRHKIALHVHAAEARTPVVSGYDVAGRQAVIVYDYRRTGARPLHGRVRPDAADSCEPLAFLARVVPTAAISVEIVPELYRQAAGVSDGFPQLVYTADLFGALATRLVGELLAGQPVRAVTVVDVHQALRPARLRWRTAAARALALARLAGARHRARRRAGPSARDVMKEAEK